ncbi:hypothetical protein BJX68DRAFT_249814 [Aspergillus pseudodeflectus]|jgi:hypothetical protein|uniref:DUF2423 domain-containing protein n=2 Tax=Aspergillus subgen. Nidulantes TaxID=2720870 RepID=A0A0U5FPZ7_ASPCI|nr:hypothetical protein ASPCAL01150 [Aspergillus calidoustus]
MAKSVRASVQKRNKAKLRATVFGPVVDARTERLSAKLQELASQPKPNDQDKSKSNAEAIEIDMQDGNPAINTESNEAMDIDTSKTSGNGSSRRSGRIQKRQRKNRSSIVFKPHPSKTRKISKKK